MYASRSGSAIRTAPRMRIVASAPLAISRASVRVDTPRWSAAA